MIRYVGFRLQVRIYIFNAHIKMYKPKKYLFRKAQFFYKGIIFVAVKEKNY